MAHGWSTSNLIRSYFASAQRAESTAIPPLFRRDAALPVAALEHGERLVDRNKRDPQLVSELQAIYRERFYVEMVPHGVSAAQFWRLLLAVVDGKSRGLLSSPESTW